MALIKDEKFLEQMFQGERYVEGLLRGALLLLHATVYVRESRPFYTSEHGEFCDALDARTIMVDRRDEIIGELSESWERS